MALVRIATLCLSTLIALAGCGKSASSWTAHGDVLLRENDLIGAEDAYNRAIAVEPHYAPALYGKGWVLYASGFDNLRPVARQLFQRAIEYQPEYFGGYRGKGVLLLEDGKVMAAEKFLRTAFEKDSEAPAVLASLGQLYLQAGRLDEAEQLFDRAMNSSSARGELHRYLAEVAMARGDLDGAMKHIETGRNSSVSGKRGLMVLDEGEERVLLERARLLLEDPDSTDPIRFEEALQALEGAGRLLAGSGGPGMSKAPTEQRRRYHRELTRRVRESLKP